MLLGIRDSVLPNAQEGIRFLNYSIFTLSNLLDGLYDVWEKKAVGIYRNCDGTTASYAFDTTTGITYTQSSKTITTISDHGLDAPYLGGVVAFYDSDNTIAYMGVIESFPTAKKIKLVSDPVGGNIANLVWTANAFPWYTDGANISSLNIKKINAVRDATNGLAIPMNHNEFEGAEDNPNLTDSVGMWDFGSGIHLKLGSGLSAHGSDTLHYNADPAEITAMTDSVDLETEHHAMIVKDVARQIEKAYPDLGKRKDQSDPFGDLRKLYEAVDFAFLNRKMGIEVAGDK